MKKASLIMSSLALAACLSAGMMFGCSSSESSEGQSSEVSFADLSEYEKIIQTNTIEKLAGADGSLSCVVETYGEESVLEDTMAIEWKMSNGIPSIQWIDTMDDGIQYTNSAYSEDNDKCGAIYSLEDGDKYVSIYSQNDFAESILDEWASLIDYEGTQSEVVTTGDQAVLEVKQEIEEGDEYYYTAKYTFNPETYILSSLEVNSYMSDSSEVSERMVLRDININSDVQLEKNPYDEIVNVDANDACNLTVVVNQLDGEKITSTYKVSRDSIADLLIADDFDMYSDEAMTTLIDEIDVSGADATVYVQVKETSDEGAEGLDIDSDEPGTEFVSDDGAVLTLGEDGNLYDEEGNVVDLDTIED